MIGIIATARSDCFDRCSRSGARASAQRIGRRSVLSRARHGAGRRRLLPMLPFDRSGGGTRHAAQARAKTDDETCEYWRYCALDGFLCTCCGGTLTSCPPGAEASKVTWVGTCQNPERQQGLSDQLQRLLRQGLLRPLPVQLQPAASGPATAWASTTTSTGAWPTTRGLYHCTVAAVIGLG